MTRPIGKLHASVYKAVKAAGPAGVQAARVYALFPDFSPKALHNHLWRLLADHHIARGEQRGNYLVNANCVAPRIVEANPREELLALISDCPAGIAEAVLAQEAGMTVESLHRHLAVDMAAGRVRVLAMQQQHGGGLGYQLAEFAPADTLQPAAAEASPLCASAATAPDDLRQYTDGRASFELTQTGQYVISCGDAFQVKLPRDVTRAMFRHLDMLGGLHNEVLLPAAGAATAGDAACA